VEYLDISCKKVRRISSLPKLKELVCKNCPNLVEISNLPELENLTVNFCKKLSSIHTLPKVKFADVSGNEAITIIQNFPELETLWCSCCPSLTHIVALPSVKDIKSQQCEKLYQIAGLPELQKIMCGRCSQLKEIYNFPKLEVLRCELSGVGLIKAVPNLQKLVSSLCYSLVWIDKLPNLKELYCGGCRNLKTIPDCEKMHFPYCDSLVLTESQRNRMKPIYITVKHKTPDELFGRHQDVIANMNMFNRILYDGETVRFEYIYRTDNNMYVCQNADHIREFGASPAELCIFLKNIFRDNLLEISWEQFGVEQHEGEPNMEVFSPEIPEEVRQA
jgi:hypothetical protein